MAVTQAQMTAEEFFMLSSSEGKQELVRGEVIEMAPAGGEHGGMQVEFVLRLAPHARQHKQGYVVTEVGFCLACRPDTVRAPDVAFIAAARYPDGRLPRAFIPGAPDLAVDVVSPGDTLTEVQQKVEEYLDAGTRLVWVANPVTQTITVHHPDRTSRTLRSDDVLSGEDVMPGFELRVADLFNR
jgi:Uma2 family endonuclease